MPRAANVPTTFGGPPPHAIRMMLDKRLFHLLMLLPTVLRHYIAESDQVTSNSQISIITTPQCRPGHALINDAPPKQPSAKKAKQDGNSRAARPASEDQA